MHRRVVAGLGIGLTASVFTLVTVADVGWPVHGAPRQWKPSRHEDLPPTSADLPPTGDDLPSTSADLPMSGARIRVEASPNPEAGASITPPKAKADAPASGRAHRWQPDAPDGIRLPGLSDLRCA